MKYIITPKALTIFARDMQYMILRTDARWADALEALVDEDEEALISLMSPSVKIKKYLVHSATTKNGNRVEFDIESKKLSINGFEAVIPEFIAQQLFAYAKEDLPMAPLLFATVKLLRNTSMRVRNKLFEFLEYGNLPFTENGNFVAYKKVDANLMDIWSTTYKHVPGAKFWMERRLVDDDPENTCSSGFHVCNFEYLPHYGSNTPGDARVVACEVDPEDVVSIPIDYNNTKMRVSRYTVIGEVPFNEDSLRGQALYG